MENEESVVTVIGEQKEEKTQKLSKKKASKEEAQITVLVAGDLLSFGKRDIFVAKKIFDVTEKRTFSEWKKVLKEKQVID